jgi:predicted ATPase
MADPIVRQSAIPAAPLLVGREREKATLREALDAALAGRGSLVLIGGEVGIGKTTLAEVTLAEAAGRGVLILVGRCYDLSETPPCGPWAEALARALGDGDLPAPPDSAGGAEVASQAALFAQVRDYLAALAGHRPLVVLLDDLHWADPASLDLLRFLGRQVAGLPLLLLATYRSDELTRRHPLYQLLPLLAREARAARLDLRPEVGPIAGTM